VCVVWASECVFVSVCVSVCGVGECVCVCECVCECVWCGRVSVCL